MAQLELLHDDPLEQEDPLEQDEPPLHEAPESLDEPESEEPMSLGPDSPLVSPVGALASPSEGRASGVLAPEALEEPAEWSMEFTIMPVMAPCMNEGSEPL